MGIDIVKYLWEFSNRVDFQISVQIMFFSIYVSGYSYQRYMKSQTQKQIYNY